MRIAPLNPIPVRSIEPAEKSDGSFAGVLTGALAEASKQEAAAEQAAQSMVAGETGIHEAVIAQEKAAIAVRFAVTLKNRAVEAYREIMNTQV